MLLACYSHKHISYRIRTIIRKAIEGKGSWNTAELFDKAGLVTIKSDGSGDKYYSRKDKKSDTSKYGHRLLLKWEEVGERTKLATEYEQENPFGEKYRYVLKSDEGKLQGELLGEINKRGSESLVGRLRIDSEDEAQENFDKLESFIGENSNELLGYIESNQNKIKEVLGETIEKVNQKMVGSIVGIRKEGEEGSERTHQKFGKAYDPFAAEQKNKQVREPILFNVKKPVSLFSGREGELTDLHNKIQRSSGEVTVISQITSISGLGGIGKTELARKYIQEYSKGFYENVIWINAKSGESLLESFTRLAKNKLNIGVKNVNGEDKDGRDIVEEVYKFFTNSKSLFIFDDVDGSDYLSEFLPLHGLSSDGNGPYILITSRNREWKRGVEVVNLNELRSEEAIKFVKKGLGIEGESKNEKIKALVEKLQYFPLAIQQAISYIEDQRVTREFDIDDYLNAYEKKTKNLLNYEEFKGIDNDYAKTTFTTWKITIDKIASDGENGRLALRVLNVISYLAPDKISREVFLGLTRVSEEELGSAVLLLIKYSMVNGKQRQSVLSTHKLVQAVTKIVLEEEGKSEEVMKETFELLLARFSYDSKKSEDYLKTQELLPHLEVFLSHVDNWLKKGSQRQKELLEEVAHMLIELSITYGTLGNYQRKRDLIESALPVLEKYHGEDHVQVATARVNLGACYANLGGYEKAKELLESALPVLKGHYGEDHFQVATARVNLGTCYRKLSDYEKAKELLESALPVLSKHYGKDHFEVATARVSLSTCYRNLGDYKKAKGLLESALPVLEKYHGEDHVQVATARVNLGACYANLGGYEKAKELLESALPVLSKHYGEDHFRVATARVNLGACYTNLGDYKKAKELIESALPVLSKHYGEDHVQVAIARVNLSVGYRNLGDDEKAKELLERALPVLRGHYGFENSMVKDISRDLLLISLDIAAKEGNFNLVKSLIEERADISEEANNRIILYQAISSNNEEVIRLILKKIKEKDPQNFYKYINGRDREGDTPLMWATKSGETSAVNILLEYGADPNTRDNNEEQIAISLEECLPSTGSGRNKREAKIGECELSWEDVDEFNTEKDEKRDFSKIEVDSERFIIYIRDLSEKKRSRLIELADRVQVKGKFSNLVNRLTSNQKVMNHLNRVKRISSMTMHGMIAKNILADFLNEDYQGVAVNVGFIAGGKGLAKVAEVASRQGLNLLSEGKALLGRSLRAASPFLARGTSAFIIYDLVNQIKAFKNGTEEALVGVVGDSIYLVVDAAEIGVEVAEGFAVLEGVSSVTGPIGTGIGAVVFVGTDVYMAVKKVKKIDQIIHLTPREIFIEGLRAFIGMQPEQHIEELMEEKQLYSQLVEQGFEYLKQHRDVQSYVFPTANNKSEPYLNSRVLLDKKRTGIKWSRARPNDPSGGKLFCFQEGNDEPAPNYGSYLCENAIGLSANKTGDYTLINLGEGLDYAKGFLNSSNIFVVNNGHKEYYGGNKNDVFILQGDLIEGFLYGGDGIDILNLTGFVQEVVNVDVYLNRSAGAIEYKHHAFTIDSVERVLGRKVKPDHIFSTCYTGFLDGQGGAKNDLDIITISGEYCTNKVQIMIRPNTVVHNQALEGSFDYLVPLNGNGSAGLKCIYQDERLNVSNTLWFACETADIKSIDVKYTNVPNRTEHEVEFNLIKSDKEFNLTISNIQVNVSCILSNGAEIKIGNKGNMYMFENTNRSAEEVIKNYLPIANRLNKMSFFIQLPLSNETVVIGSGNHEVIHNNPAYKSHLVGNGGENVYEIDFEIDSKIDNVPEIVIHDIDEENSIDTIDLRRAVKKAKDNFELQVIKIENDLLFKATVEKQKDEYFTVRLKDGVERYNKIHVIVENAPMIINFDNNQWSLKPQPLMFEEDKEIIVVMGQDVEKGAEIVTPRKGGNYTFVRSNSDNLMITNAFDSTITEDDLCSIILSEFYKTPKMKTLSIKFADKEIVLKDHEKEISAARDVNVVKKEHDDQVYNDVFNREGMMLSDQPHRYGHKHSRRHIGNRRSEYTMSSGTRPSSWINDLFGWVKSSVSGLLSSKPALPKKTSNTTNSISQVDAKMDVNGTIMLLDMLVRKFTVQKYISTADQSISPLEAQGYALNIIGKFEKVVEQAALKSGISIHRLNIDFVEIQKEVKRKIMSGKFNEISRVLKSHIEKACPGREAGCPGKLSSKKFNKFIVEFDKALDAIVNQSIQQILHKRDDTLEVNNIEEQQEPRNYLNNTSIQGHLTRNKVKLIS